MNKSKPKREVRIKAWAVIFKGDLLFTSRPANIKTSPYAIFASRHDPSKEHDTVFVPCTITYSLPTKKLKKIKNK